MQETVHGGAAATEAVPASYASKSHHLLGLAAVSVLAYFPFQTLPFISDDYTQIWLSRIYGPPSGWGELARDALYRCRATSLILTHGLDLAFGLWPPAYFVTGLFLHILNTWLVYALGLWRSVGYRISIPAAYIFAVRSGQQEAVVWHAASPELLVLAFVLATVLAWAAWLQAGRRSALFYAGSLLAFSLALLSKESAVSAVGFLVLVGVVERSSLIHLARPLIPFILLSLIYAGGIFLGRQDHLHLRDGTFSVAAQWWVTLPHSFARMVWFWGVLAAVVLASLRMFRHRMVGFGVAWMVIGLLPYSFLLYMNRVPSRHTYMAGVGISLFIASAYLSVRDREPLFRRAVLSATLGLAFLVHNCAYLWLRKLPQYERRAAVSEQFLSYAREHPGLIRVRCYPGSAWTAKHSAHMVLGRPLDSVVDATVEKNPLGPDDYCDDSKH